MVAALLIFSSTLGAGVLGTWMIVLIGRVMDETKTYMERFLITGEGQPSKGLNYMVNRPGSNPGPSP